MGDSHHGDNDSDLAAPLEESRVAERVEGLASFIEACDTVILNLETPLLDLGNPPAPLASNRLKLRGVGATHYGPLLKRLKVGAVSLANNHIYDYGEDGLESTFKELESLGIELFGAGRSLDEASAPLRLVLPDRVGGGEIHFHGLHQFSTRSDQHLELYADHDSPGCAPLRHAHVPPARRVFTREDSLQVAFPHWGRTGQWRSQEQYRLAHQLLKKDYDLVLGHGAHTLQEVHRKQQRWVVFGIGDGLITAGESGQHVEGDGKGLPLSFWSVLEIHKDAERRWITLKLYPVSSIEGYSDLCASPIDAKGFEKLIASLSEQSVRPWRFDNPAQSTGVDELGYFIALDIGEWVPGNQPSRLDGPLPSGDPADWPLRSPDLLTEDRVLGLRRDFGSGPVALAAEAEGASVHWLTSALALVAHQDKRLILHTYRAHESSLGSTIVRDKAFSAELFNEAGVASPDTLVVKTSEEAVSASLKMPGPVVIKPRSGKKSLGVSTGLIADDEIRDAFAYARQHGSEVLIQQHIEAVEELRVMASPDRAVAVIRRIAPHVIGDGVSTIKQLIEDKNQQRRLNPSLRNRPIPVDILTRRYLNRANRSLEDVPELGEKVTVRAVAGLSAGADAFQALEEASAEIRRTATTAIASIPGLGWGGVDIIIEKDTGKPYVIEINTKAAYGAALFPTYGEPRDVATDVWHLRFAATYPETTSAPEQPKVLVQPTRMAQTSGSMNVRLDFDRLFQESLLRQGYSIRSKTPKIIEVTSPAGDQTLVTTSGLASADRSVVQQVMQGHHWVSELLELREIPKTRARTVTSTRQLKRFVEGRVGEVIMRPVSTPWVGADADVLSEAEVLKLTSVPEPMWVQARPRGRRVRVLATQEKAWLVTSEISTRSLDARSIEAASDIAVRALRAIPELRWAAIDVLVRPTRIKENRGNGVLIEGITRQPSYSADDTIIAGDFDDFCRVVAYFPSYETSVEPD